MVGAGKSAQQIVQAVDEGRHVLALHGVHAAEHWSAVAGPAGGDAGAAEPLDLLSVRRQR